MQNTEIEIKLQSVAQLATEKANSIIIESDDSLVEAADCVKYIKTRFNEAEKERKNLVEPFNAGVKNINSRFKQITEPLEQAERIIKGKMLTYQTKREAEKRAEEERKRQEVAEYAKAIAEQQKQKGNSAQAELMLKQLDVAMLKPVEIEKVRSDSTGTTSTIKKRWTYKVVDIVALANSRPDLVEEISTLIRKEIANGARDIQGLEIYQESELSIR